MSTMNRRELIQKALAGTAVVAAGMSVVPRAIEAAPLSTGKTLPPDSAEEFVHEVWNGYGRRRRRWRRRRRQRWRRRYWRRRYWRRRYWDCWWHRGYRVCGWRWY
jgi:hypothetical protein